jgi:hypothetical protein
MVSGGKILAFGDRIRGEEWTGALMEFKMDRPDQFKTVHSFSLESTSRNYARLGFPMLASAGGKNYALLIEGSPSIFEVHSGTRRLDLKNYPEGFNSFPSIEQKINETTVANVYKGLENAQMPVALYGKGDFLYLLLRRPSAKAGETTWLLAKIDPRKEEVFGPVKLPTNGRHILLSPGNKEWAIIEKDRVEGLGKQNVTEIILMPSSWPEEGTWPEKTTINTESPVQTKG